MWKNHIKFSMCSLLLFCVFCVMGPGTTLASDTTQKTQQVTMSVEQFNSLRTQVAELKSRWTQQDNELKTLRKQLTESKQATTKAEQYLTDYKQNLMTLQEQTDLLIREKQHIKQQRDLAWIVAGGLLLWGGSK